MLLFVLYGHGTLYCKKLQRWTIHTQLLNIRLHTLEIFWLHKPWALYFWHKVNHTLPQPVDGQVYARGLQVEKCGMKLPATVARKKSACYPNLCPSTVRSGQLRLCWKWSLCSYVGEKSCAGMESGSFALCRCILYTCHYLWFPNRGQPETWDCQIS